MAGSESFPYESLYDDYSNRQNPRWLPYEFYHIPDSVSFRPNTKTDVWAFGMTLFVRSKFKRLRIVFLPFLSFSIQELLTGKIPYDDISDHGELAPCNIERETAK